VRELRSIVGDAVPDKDLIALLKQVRWNTTTAMDRWFAEGMDQQYKFAPQVDESKIK